MHRISLDGPPDREHYPFVLWRCSVAWASGWWGHIETTILSSRSPAPKKSLVVSSPSPPGSLLSWTNGTCVGLVAELRGTVDFPSVRRPAVSMMNDVEGPASSWRAPCPVLGQAFFRSRLSGSVPGEARQASRDRLGSRDEHDDADGQDITRSKMKLSGRHGHQHRYFKLRCSC